MLRVFSEGKPELQAFRWHGCETGPRHQRASARVTASKNELYTSNYVMLLDSNESY